MTLWNNRSACNAHQSLGVEHRMVRCIGIYFLHLWNSHVGLFHHARNRLHDLYGASLETANNYGIWDGSSALGVGKAHEHMGCILVNSLRRRSSALYSSSWLMVDVEDTMLLIPDSSRGGGASGTFTVDVRAGGSTNSGGGSASIQWPSVGDFSNAASTSISEDSSWIGENDGDTGPTTAMEGDIVLSPLRRCITEGERSIDAVLHTHLILDTSYISERKTALYKGRLALRLDENV